MTLNVTAYTGMGPGQHDVNVTGVSVKTAKAGGEYLRWEFTDADGKTASANTSKEITPGNKTGKWFATLTGTPTEVGQARQLAEVLGAGATIEIELNDEGYPKVTNLIGRRSAPRASRSFAQTSSNDSAHAALDKLADDALPF